MAMELDATGKATLPDTPPKNAKTAQGDDQVTAENSPDSDAQVKAEVNAKADN
jgi:hypothetical protein